VALGLAPKKVAPIQLSQVHPEEMIRQMESAQPNNS
jgi:hypothetical protein